MICNIYSYILGHHVIFDGASTKEGFSISFFNIFFYKFSRFTKLNHNHLFHVHPAILLCTNLSFFQIGNSRAHNWKRSEGDICPRGIFPSRTSGFESLLEPVIGAVVVEARPAHRCRAKTRFYRRPRMWPIR